MKHINGLDTIRALAVLFVIESHWGLFYRGTPVTAFIGKYFIPNGPAGVDLFFVLSGFLITGILLHAKNTCAHSNQLLVARQFIIRRALRIFPIYYLLVLSHILMGYGEVRAHAFYYLTYTSNILLYWKQQPISLPHTWSLAVEEQFYLLWPWLILFVKNKYLDYIFLLAIAIGIAGGYLSNDILHKSNYPILVHNCIGCLGLGGYYAYAIIDNQRNEIFRKIFRPFFILCSAIYFYRIYNHDSFGIHTAFLFRMINGVMALQLIIFTLNNKSKLLKKYFFENRILNYIGKISYGLYLYHYTLPGLYDRFFVDSFAKHRGINKILTDHHYSKCFKVLLLIVVCTLSYKYIEEPLLRLKNRFRYSSAQSPAEQPASSTL